MPAIIDWAKDTYRFYCRLWGEKNIIGFDVHCDETGVHAPVLTGSDGASQKAWTHRQQIRTQG